mgnify:CR=1 FL=1
MLGIAVVFLYAATIEFYLDWLEERDGDYDDGIFGSLASGLVMTLLAQPTRMLQSRPRKFTGRKRHGFDDHG